MMKKLGIFIFLVIAVLICTVRIHAQTAQVSPVANLSDNENVSVMNDNIQFLQNGINSAFNTFSQYFTGGILNTKNGGTGQNSLNWTAGDFVYMTSTGVWGHTAANHGSQVFTTSGTFTPTFTGKVYVTACSNGGNGGGSGSGVNKTYGGGASGYQISNYPYSVTANSGITVTIGGHGANTVFGTLTLLPGNDGASSGTSPLGGSCDGGTLGICTSGQTGGVAETNPMGYGGGSILGVGAAAVQGGNSNGVSASPYCAGGAGVSMADSNIYSGGSGSQGIVIVQW